METVVTADANSPDLGAMRDTQLRIDQIRIELNLLTR
jgi:hypothetical protein